MRAWILVGMIFMGAGMAFGVEGDGVFTYRIGRLEVSVLVESEREGNVSVIPTAGEDVLRRYIPAAGFKMSTNIFLIKGPERTVLVDTAFGGESFNRMRSLGVRPEDVDAVLITHMHQDHIGGLAKEGVALFPNARLYIAEKDFEHFVNVAANAGAIAAVAPYRSRLETFDPGELGTELAELLPGITAIAAYGHTPGHTAFLLESEGQRFLIVGDLLHVAPVQFPRPDINASFDINGEAAAATRRQILAYAAENRIPVAGTHIAWPGSGIVRVEGEGFSWMPARR